MVGLLDIILVHALVWPPHMGCVVFGAPQYIFLVVSWFAMRYFGNLFFRNDTAPLVKYYCADYEHRLDAAVPEEKQRVPFKWPMAGK